jgi:hypothetical protein
MPTSSKARTGRHRGRQSGKWCQLRQVGMQAKIRAEAERSRQYRQTEAVRQAKKMG